jgi:LuxR family transcriptional regulator, regulator of acetate metabolism
MDRQVEFDAAGARALLGSLRQLEREIVELRYTQRLDATDRVREALRRLAETGPRPLETLERAAAELGGAAGFDRVLSSRVRGAILHPAALWVAGEAPGRDVHALMAVPIAAGSAEAEVVANGRTVVVDPARATPTLAAAIGSGAVVVGAIAPRGEVIALVHGTVDPRRRALGELDRELVALFAGGLGGVLERVALEHALGRHRGELAGAARFLAQRPGSAGAPASGPPAGAAADAAAQAGADPLTGRELEVLSLLAEGRTNRAVGERLGISEGTVKYHVKNILRKLRARSRADAVARHLRASATR